MYQWLNRNTQRRHLADNFEMTTYCGRRMSDLPWDDEGPRWRSLGKVETQSLGSQKNLAEDLCSTCASMAQPFYFESETGQTFGPPIPRTHRLPLDEAGLRQHIVDHLGCFNCGAPPKTPCHHDYGCVDSDRWVPPLSI